MELRGRDVLPLFWLALLDEADVRGEWEAGLRAAFTEEAEGDEPVPPLVVRWHTARAHLVAAAARAPERAPAVAGMLREWADGLLASAARQPAMDRVEFHLGDYAGYYWPDADALLGVVLDGARLWNGVGEPHPPAWLLDPAMDLRGLGPNLRPFPEDVPRWTTERTERRRALRRHLRRGFALVGARALAVAGLLANLWAAKLLADVFWDEANPWPGILAASLYVILCACAVLPTALRRVEGHVRRSRR